MMSELRLRIITAVILLLACIIWMFYSSDAWFMYITCAIGMLSAHELLALLRMPQKKAYLIISALLFAMLAANMTLLPVLMLAMVLWVLPLLFSAKEGDVSFFQKMLASQWMMLWLLCFVWVLSQLHQSEQGFWLLCGAMLGIWGSDIGAYFTGKRWGKHKLCPAISPGKSWEGFVGGLCIGGGVAMVFWMEMMTMPWYQAMAMAIVLVVVGVLGDLMESALKRSVGAKDSGDILPGHGGVLDRIDALLPAIPVTGFLWWAITI